MAVAARRAVVPLLARLGGALAGGYLASAALVAAAAVLLPRTGLARSEAVIIASMAGFPLYLVLLLWGAATRALVRYGAILAALTVGGYAAVRLFGSP